MNLNIKYFDISIENISRKSIEFDIEMKVYKPPECEIILEKDLRAFIKKRRNKTKSPFNYALLDFEPELLDFYVHSEESSDYIILSRIKLRNQKTAIRLSQQEVEEFIFNKTILIMKEGICSIKADIIIRSDDFTEGILFQTLEIETR